mmetsp:Transcript_15187/g.22549  ORF Transcript_15187/g.22549 Transcript_15187/m.22549 type:complete len:1052 (+) Transcript_15187:210-3365(+)
MSRQGGGNRETSVMSEKGEESWGGDKLRKKSERYFAEKVITNYAENGEDMSEIKDNNDSSDKRDGVVIRTFSSSKSQKQTPFFPATATSFVTAPLELHSPLEISTNPPTFPNVVNFFTKLDEFDRFVSHEDFPKFLAVATRVKMAKERIMIVSSAVSSSFPSILLSLVKRLDMNTDRGTASDLRNISMTPLLTGELCLKAEHIHSVLLSQSSFPLLVTRGMFPATDFLLDEAVNALATDLKQYCSIASAAKVPASPLSCSSQISVLLSTNTTEIPAYSPKKKKRRGGKDEREGVGEAIAVKYKKKQTDILNDWMIMHRDHPFPDSSEIEVLGKAAGLKYSQVVNWTTNIRKRSLKATVENGKKPHNFLDFLFLAEDRDKKLRRSGKVRTGDDMSAKDANHNKTGSQSVQDRSIGGGNRLVSGNPATSRRRRSHCREAQKTRAAVKTTRMVPFPATLSFNLSAKCVGTELTGRESDHKEHQHPATVTPNSSTPFTEWPEKWHQRQPQQQQSSNKINGMPFQRMHQLHLTSYQKRQFRVDEGGHGAPSTSFNNPLLPTTQPPPPPNLQLPLHSAGRHFSGSSRHVNPGSTSSGTIAAVTATTSVSARYKDRSTTAQYSSPPPLPYYPPCYYPHHLSLYHDKFHSRSSQHSCGITQLENSCRHPQPSSPQQCNIVPNRGSNRNHNGDGRGDNAFEHDNQPDAAVRAPYDVRMVSPSGDGRRRNDYDATTSANSKFTVIQERNFPQSYVLDTMDSADSKENGFVAGAIGDFLPYKKFSDNDSYDQSFRQGFDLMSPITTPKHKENEVEEEEVEEREAILRATCDGLISTPVPSDDEDNYSLDECIGVDFSAPKDSDAKNTSGATNSESITNDFWTLPIEMDDTLLLPLPPVAAEEGGVSLSFLRTACVNVKNDVDTSTNGNSNINDRNAKGSHHNNSQCQMNFSIIDKSSGCYCHEPSSSQTCLPLCNHCQSLANQRIFGLCTNHDDNTKETVETHRSFELSSSLGSATAVSTMIDIDDLDDTFGEEDFMEFWGDEERQLHNLNNNGSARGAQLH